MFDNNVQYEITLTNNSGVDYREWQTGSSVAIGQTLVFTITGENLANTIMSNVAQHNALRGRTEIVANAVALGCSSGGGGGVALGETSSTAYRGDNGKIAYDHSQSQGNPHNTTTTDINEGTKLFFTEPRVRQTVLTGLDTSTATPALATDQLLAAIGKLQAQINSMGSGGGSGGGTASYPSFTGNTGKVLVVNATEDGVEWITLPSGGGEPPSIEIPSNEMHFTTLAGVVEYLGTEGDQILLSDGTIVDITATDGTVTFNAPAGKHKVKLVESAERNNYVSVGGEALVELHNFPTLSTVTKFNFTTGNYNPLPNLTKVPNFLPSNIINVEGLFVNASSFNQDISMWDVSNVTNMAGMFYGASAFNQPLNNWDVSNVTAMDSMFASAIAFNQDISGWNVSNVTNMDSMFYNASAFDQPLNNWNVSNVTNMNYMFGEASSFNQDLNNWNVSNVADMGYMFYNATSFNQPLNNWDVSNVTNMSGIFYNASAFNQPLNNWNVSNVTKMHYMFAGASSFDQNITGWDVSNVTNATGMFENATSFNQDLSNWCVSKISTMPIDFNNGAPLLVGAKLPVWGTCPAP